MNRDRFLCWPLLFLLLAAWPAFAGDRTPVGVLVRFEVPLLSHDWTEEERRQIRGQISGNIADLLQQTYTYWNFRAGNDQVPFLLTLRVKDPDPLDHRQQASIVLQTSVRGRPGREWSHAWLEPTDFDYRLYPDAADMPDAISSLFSRHFLRNQQVDFGEWLKNEVPVARAGKWRADDKSSLQIVLAMPYDSFSALGYSIFLIKARKPGHLPRTLKAQGIGIGLPYPPAAPSPVFMGLAVQTLNGEAADHPDAAATLYQGLTLGPVFLKREEYYDYDYE